MFVLPVFVTVIWLRAIPSAVNPVLTESHKQIGLPNVLGTALRILEYDRIPTVFWGFSRNLGQVLF